MLEAPVYSSLIGQRWEAPQEMARALISAWVIIQVQLMILLSVPPLSCREDFSHDATLPPLLVDLFCDLTRLLFLLGVVVEYCGSVLAAAIRTLLVRSRRVVHLVEELEECAVSHLLGIINHLECFGV